MRIAILSIVGRGKLCEIFSSTKNGNHKFIASKREVSSND